jgi:hypothetical protein
VGSEPTRSAGALLIRVVAKRPQREAGAFARVAEKSRAMSPAMSLLLPAGNIALSFAVSFATKFLAENNKNIFWTISYILSGGLECAFGARGTSGNACKDRGGAGAVWPDAQDEPARRI